MTSPASAMRGFNRALPIALLRTREATMRLFKPHVDDAGLSLPQWRVLRALAEDGAEDASKLAERCAVMPSSLSRILAALEKRGLLTRDRGEKDARRAALALTPEGQALFTRIAPRSEEVYQQLETEFGAERLAHLLSELDALSQAALSLEKEVL